MLVRPILRGTPVRLTVALALALALAAATPAKAPGQVAAPVALRVEPSRGPRAPSIHATARPWRPHYIGYGVLAGALVGAPMGWTYAKGQCERPDCNAGEAGLLGGMAIGAVIGGLIGLLVALPTGS